MDLQKRTEFLLLSFEHEGSAESNKKEINQLTRRGCLSGHDPRQTAVISCWGCDGLTCQRWKSAGKSSR